jgi:small multidrug resistance family-3 protein
MSLVGSFGLYVLAGLCEIGGGYLMWLAIRGNRHWTYAAMGAVVLVLYGIIPTLQPAHFGRVYAAYGGMFIVLSLLWGWGIDGVRLDRYDVIGAIICLGGMIVIMYAPRT